jgi:predicted protein tyrosine phosphatase
MPLLSKRITICGLLDLEEHARTSFGYVVSILDPDKPEPEELRFLSANRRCTLRFHDTLESSGFMIAPQVSHVSDLLEFGRLIDVSSNQRVLVHCFAGLCRSTAAALLLIAQSDRAIVPEDAVSQLLAIAPNAWPNSRMVELGDEMLSYKGRLANAVRAHQRSVCERYPMLGSIMQNAHKN